MSSKKPSLPWLGHAAPRVAAVAMTLFVLGAPARVSADDPGPWWSASEPAMLPGAAQGRSMSDSPEFRYEALTRPARFRSTQTRTDLAYEDRLATYTDTQMCARTVCDDQGCWQKRCCWSIFGWHTVCCWCPKLVEVQVADTVNVARQRVERTPIETTSQIRTTVSEPVVVQSRRPYTKKSFADIENEVITRRLNRDRMAYRPNSFEDAEPFITTPLGD